MAGTTEYSINLDTRYSPLELVDLQTLIDQCKDKWYNQTLCQVNDCVVRLGIFEGEFHWHKHDDEDEFFYVIEGLLSIDLEERSVDLGPKQGFTVPKGVVHKTRAAQKTIVLMIEGAGIKPTGD
jgi:mannose-6-phosphate isomerase-like protein (cupin superfamily)